MLRFIRAVAHRRFWVCVCGGSLKVAMLKPPNGKSRQSVRRSVNDKVWDEVWELDGIPDRL
jgi:hypothetical protein